MTRCTRAAILLIALTVTTVADAGQPDATLAEDECRAPFNLVVPAQVVRQAGGLTVVAHDDGAGQRLIFDLAIDAISVTLQRKDGTTDLARAEVPLRGDAKQVILKRKPGGAAVAYDARTVLRAEADLPDGGRWGVLGAPAEILDEIMLQPVADVVFGDDFMRTPGQPATWDQSSGEWRVAQLASAKYSANAFTLLGHAGGGGEALATTGYWFWEDLTVEASVRPSEGARGFGVALACQADGDCYLLRFVPDNGAVGIAQLVRVLGGQETILDEAPAVAHPDEWHRLALSGTGGHLTGALDGAELVSAEAPALAHGQVGLWVRGGEEVAFDDVQAYSGARRSDGRVVLSHEAQTSDATAEPFINDQYMQEWADERDQWRRGSGGVWHSGYFFGDVELAWDVDERSLREETALHICVPVDGETLSPPGSPEQGCHLTLTEADGKVTVALREGAEVRAEEAVPLPALPATVALRRRGDTVEALLGAEVVAGFEASTPAAGKVGLTGGAAHRGASALRVTSWNMIDSTFRDAPTDWHVGSGDWGVSSRWDCTPRWSWFQGRSDELASVWTRPQFTGDVVVEFFAGISMDQPWAPFYQHPGNLCVTLCGSNDTPGSGYSLVFAGWGNSAAGIFRRGELVAKVPGFTMPDILDSLGGTTGREDAHKLHNEWYHVRAERIGNTVRLLVDGKLACSFEDPEPLPGGAAGVWTLDQALTVARARIYYEQAEHAPPMIVHRETATALTALPVPDFRPAHVASTFEAGPGGWAAVAEGVCEVALAEREGRDGGRCLRLTNPTAGGTFAVAAPWKDIDLSEHTLLAFDYAIPEDVRVDIFATVAGKRHRIALTGPEGDAQAFEDAGSVPDVRADGRWREARVDLLGLLRPFVPDGPIVLEALEFAAYAAPEYMRAGIGGNPEGASWRLDDIYLGGVTAESVEVETPRDVSVEAPGARVDRDLHMGRARHRIIPTRSEVAGVALSSGARTGTDLIAFDLDAPRIERVEAENDVLLRITDEGPAGVDERSLSVRVGDRRIGWGDPGLRWEPAEGRLMLDTVSAGLSAGEDVTVRVTADDRAGNAAEALEFAFAPEAASGEAPTAANLPPPLLNCDFETDVGPIEPWGVDAAVDLTRMRDPVAGNGDGGQWCLQARCTELGGLFGVSLGCAPFEASRFPVLQFDYRAPEELRVDLIVEVDGTRRVIKFTDNDQSWRPIARIDAMADDQWHHATIDLHDLLAPAFGRDAPLVVTELAFATSGWPGNREDTRWWLDNVRLGVTEAPAEQADTQPPVASDLSPADGANACPETVAVTVTDEGSGVSPADLRLTVNERTWTVADQELEWDGQTGRLTWELPADVSLGQDGARVNCRLDAVDLAGNAMEPLRWTFTLDRALDEQPPAAPVVSYVPARAADSNDFESGTGGWGNFVAGQVLRLAEGGATGPGCVEIRHLGGRGNGFVLVRDFGEGWREFPMVRFRYRAQNTRRAGLEVYGTTFDGTKDRWTKLASPTIFGNGWLTGVLDVEKALARTSPSLDIHRIFLSIDLPADGTLLVDDYAMYSQAATEAGFRWVAPADPSGIAGYSWVLDSADDTVPPEKISGSATEVTFGDLEPGHYCFHLRALDGAGNWGPAAHVPFDLIATE